MGESVYGNTRFELFYCTYVKKVVDMMLMIWYDTHSKEVNLYRR